MDALNAIPWLKSSFWALFTFVYHKRKKEERVQKKKKKNEKTEKGVFYHLDAILKPWLTPKCWSTPGESRIFLNFV